MSEKVVLVLLAVEAGAVNEGLALKAGSRSCHHGMWHQGVCHQDVCYQGMYHQCWCRQGEFDILPSRRAYGREGMEIWRRDVGVAIWWYGVLGRAVGVKSWRHGGISVGRRDTGVKT